MHSFLTSKSTLTSHFLVDKPFIENRYWGNECKLHYEIQFNFEKKNTKYQSTLKFKVFGKDWDEQDRSSVLTSIEAGPGCLWAVHHCCWVWKGWESSEFYLYVCSSELMRLNDLSVPVASILVYLRRKVNAGSSTIFSSCLLCSFWDHGVAALPLCT